MTERLMLILSRMHSVSLSLKCLVQRSHSLGMGHLGTGLWSLMQALSLWFSAFEHSGPLVLLPRQKHLRDQAMWGPQRLRPHRRWSPLLQSGSHAGMHPSLGSSIWDIMI